MTASTSAGWAWPSALTAMPPSRSTYSVAVGVPDVGALAAGRAPAWAGRRCSSGTAAYRSWRLGHGHCASRGLADLGLDAGQHLGADALVGEDLEQDGVRLAAVDHGGARDAARCTAFRQAPILGTMPLARLGISSASASGLISPITSSLSGQSR